MLAALLLACSAAATAAEPTWQVDDAREVAAHLIGPAPVLQSPWQDLTLRTGDRSVWYFRLTVDAKGRVVKALPTFGPAEHGQRALALARGLRFKPFEREGRAVPVVLSYEVVREVQDYVGGAGRAWPGAGTRPEDMSIALRRTGCYGSCPSYRLELRGDGFVTYWGESHVVAEGHHQWRVAPTAVAAMVERFRQADYFKLKGTYIAHTTDLPSYIIRLSLGAQKKTVVDYGGAEPDLPILTGRQGPQMPRAVTELEDAIDAVAGSASWVRGDADTMARLRAVKFDFGSSAAKRGLGVLLTNCQLSPATEFIRAGTSAEGEADIVGSLPTLRAATRCGDLALVHRLVSQGALDRPADLQAFLKESVDAGYPELVAIALERGASVRSTDAYEVPLIAHAAAARPRARGPSAHFDPVQVIDQLRKAGASVQDRDGQGHTAIFSAGSPAVVAALVRAGLDPNAHDSAGNTPLESTADEPVAQALLAAGAKLPTHPARLLSLQRVAASFHWMELLPAIERAASAAQP